jgi:hypothetical protein
MFMKQQITFFLLFISFQIFSQKKDYIIDKQAIILQVTPIFSKNHLGSQIGLQKLQNQIEVHKKNQKIIFRERFLGLDLSYYSQHYLHNSLSLMPNYTFRRTNPYGFYRQIRPFLGISKTFLNEESYSVNDKNEAVLNGLRGNFYITSGSNLELGKVFKKESFINDLHVGLMLQAYYPNFRFFALRPSYSVGTSFKINSMQKGFRKKIIQK